MKRVILPLLIVAVLAGSLFAQSENISTKTESMKKLDGFFPVYWDEGTGKTWLEIDKPEIEFLYIVSLPAGLGSNDIGLDRNQLGRSRIVSFKRIGPRVLMTQPNYQFRAESDNPDERKAVEDAFAKSVIWGFDISAEEDGRILVDATKFFLRDAHNAAGTLQRTRQGSFKMDASKSAFYLPGTKNFPKNTEIETIITLCGDNPGYYVRSVTPDPRNITLRQRHSFVELPDNNYVPRVYKPGSSVGFITYYDYAAPIGKPIAKRYIRRHRLEKKDPEADISDPVEPIVFYVDRGTPEPVLSALVEGASWWNIAFEAAGYRNAYQVKVMPEGADPMDIRYNMINWVHRSTRGWSYGSSVTDPRTGEIIKGHVTLGSLRIRQDFMIAQGLLAPYKQGQPVSIQMEEMGLARIRQLSVHEVGHTIGFMHNYTSSAHERASVMDYPHPLVKINENGSFDLTDAYDRGIGEWDKVSVAFAYQDFPEGTDENKALEEILSDARDRGLYSLTDQDARPRGSAHPLTHLWDNGKHPVDELRRVLKIRSLALERFSEDNIPPGAPLATLEDVLVPVYLFHRYQVEAAAKVIGGSYYYYNIRGDGQKLPEIVSPKEQRNALAALISTLTPEVLAIDEKITDLIPPRPPGYSDSPELFRRFTGPTFDPLAAAETAADFTLGLLLDPQRAARLVDYNARDSKYPGQDEVLESILNQTINKENGSGYYAEINRTVDKVVLNNILTLGATKNTSAQVLAIVLFKIDELNKNIQEKFMIEQDKNQKAHFFYMLQQIREFYKDPDKFTGKAPLVLPNGSPIGTLSGDLFK